MFDEGIGLTKLYNQIHDPSVVSGYLLKLRELQQKLDYAVLEAYEWTDIPLNYDFREVPHLPSNDRLRYAISENARLEILRRLMNLNRQKYEIDQIGENQKGVAGRRKAGSRSLSHNQEALWQEPVKELPLTENVEPLANTDQVRHRTKASRGIP